MAKSTSVYSPKGYTVNLAKLANADGTASKTVGAAGADDSVVKNLSLTSTDTVARKVEIIVRKGGVDYVIDTKDVPAGAGTDGATAAVDGLSAGHLPLDRVSKKVLPLDAGCELRVRAQVAVAAAKEIHAAAVFENF